MLALGVGATGCTGEYVPEIDEYSLTVSTTEGGDVTTPGEGTFKYYAGEVVSLVAVADDGYCFANWAGDASTIADLKAAATTITMNDSYSITANFSEIPAAYDFTSSLQTFSVTRFSPGLLERGQRHQIGSVISRQELDEQYTGVGQPCELDLVRPGIGEINDISPLIQKHGLATEANAFLARNPLSTYSVNTYVPQLLARRGCPLIEVGLPSKGYAITSNS
jgi:hypothetical protein